MTSLYDTLHNADCLPRELTLSPATFKLVISAMFDLLRTQQVSATIIAKLPREAIWYESLERYRQSPRCHSSTYLLKPQARRSIYDDSPETCTRVCDNGTSGGGLYAVEPQPSPMTEIWLPNDNPLRRDFFVLILSPEFQGLLLSHRQPKDRAQMAQVAAAMDSSAEALPPSEEQSPAKSGLKSLHSFEPTCLQLGLNAIIRYVEALQLRSQAPRELTPVLEHWLTLSEQVSGWQPNVALWTSLWTQHLQHYERLRQSHITLKPKAAVTDELQVTNQKLIETIAQKTEFSKRVGQELRAPLASMKTALSILSSQSLKPLQRQRYIDMLSQECDRQSALINSVLEIIHLDELDDNMAMESVKLVDVVPGVVSTYQPLANEQDVMLAYTIPDDLPAVACSSPWVKQIVINLLHNGIKFTPSEGRVWVRAIAKRDHVQLDVEDTGIGIAPGDIPKVFERFYRIRSKTEKFELGSGLGLSVVQQLLQKCGGTIHASSELGKGTTFCVLLPIHRAN
ncbi:MAG: ATP-binding protein [Elainellaceae cyanobacterium]